MKMIRVRPEVARLLREVHRYQGYENKAVAIGLVNEPRYTKNISSTKIRNKIDLIKIKKKFI